MLLLVSKSGSGRVPWSFRSSHHDFPRARAVIFALHSHTRPAQDVTTPISKMWSKNGLIRGKKSWIMSESLDVPPKAHL
jgi:hypothetical protein